jgi:prevent-host-death family protein
MYREIGSFDAKAKLSELLREVQLGQRFTITLRGRPVADLVPSGSAGLDPITAINAMRAIPKIIGVSAETITDWIGEGRK